MNITELQRIMLAITDVCPFDEVLHMIARALANQPGVLLTRIWLNLPGDLCEQCVLRDHCHDRDRCLHLVASQTRPGLPESPGLEDMDSFFRRFPLGLRILGTVGKTGESVWLRDIEDESIWLARTVQRGTSTETPGIFRDDVAGVRSFIGHPLVFRGETLGVLGVFCDHQLEEVHYQWLKTFADHAAVAVNNARTFEELHELHRRLELGNSFLISEARNRETEDDIVGNSPALLQVLDRSRLVARTDATVLLTGESGTGKTQLAKFIHTWGGRARGNFVHVNCGSITSNLFESEFFGHVKGAFTGAFRDRIGRFQFADQGTLFLDEVGEIPPDLQCKLLRVVQTGMFERVGEDVSRRVDVRIIAATNRNLADLVKDGSFREDLYFRLSVFPVELPPLSRRVQDIPLLAQHFLERICCRLKRPVPELDGEQIAFLQACDWKGNIRELENTIERALIVSRGSRLTLEDWCPKVPRSVEPLVARKELLTAADLRRIERENLVAILEATGGRIYGKGGAAAVFGVPPTTIVSRLKSLGISAPKLRV